MQAGARLPQPWLLLSCVLALLPAAVTAHPGRDAGDRRFVERAACEGMSEVQLAKLAMERGGRPEVRAYARRTLEEHTRLNTQLAQLASHKGYPLPTEVSPAGRATYVMLEKLRGDEFDREYLRVEAEEHDAEARDCQSEIESGQDDEVKQWAARALPVLKRHDEMARRREAPPPR